MRTNILSKVLIVLLCSVNFITTHAQGLSLSFNLTDNDTLANMIADSKKYEISSLTLSGYINEENTKYIKDLNTNGRLISLGLSGVSHICAYYLNKKKYTFHYSGRPNYIWTNSEVGEMYQFIKQYGFSGIPGECPYVSHNGINDDRNVYITIIEEHHDNMYTVTLNSSYTCPYGDNVSGSECKTKSYSISYPKLMFQDNSFSKLVLPDNIEQIGDIDCRFRFDKCGELVLGKNLKSISANALKGSYIGTIEVSSVIDNIKASAFENATGNIMSSPLFLETAKYIGDNAFKNSSLVQGTSGSLALQATKIGNNAFFNAIIPQNIVLPNIEEIGNSSFMSSTVVNVDMGNKIKNLSNSTFENCGALKTFRGGTNIEQIGNRAFYGCKQLNAFTPSNILRTIGQEAFANNMDLVSFSIPNTTESIGHDAFANSGLKELDLADFCNYHRDIVSGCDSLEIISVNSSNTKMKSANGVLLSEDESRIITYPCAKKDVLYEISSKVTEIEDSAFYGVNKLRALTISENVSKIGKNAFGNSSILELKALPSTTPKVTYNISGLDQSLVRLFVHDKDYSTYYMANYWGDFKNIFVLENAVSPDNLINVEVAGTLPNFIGFGNQFKYNSLRLSGKLNGDDIRYLREMAGRDVNGKETAGILTDLDFSQASIVKGGDCYYKKNENSSGKLTTDTNEIGESMFEGCYFSNLVISENAIKIDNKALYGCPLTTFRLPYATQNISMSAFYGMFNLKEFTVDNENGKYQSIDNVLFTKDGKTLLLYPYAKEGERYNIPETVTTIEEQAFGGLHLKTITANEGLKEIETLAFDNLGSLEAINLPSTLERIGHRAFWGCNKLMDISCKAYYPPTLEYDPYAYFGQPYNNFSDKTYENAVLLVPQKNGGYKSRSGWKLFNNVIESDDWMSGIQTINDTDNKEIVRCYDLNGRVVMSTFRGISIIKMSNGTSKKVFVK